MKCIWLRILTLCWSELRDKYLNLKKIQNEDNFCGGAPLPPRGAPLQRISRPSVGALSPLDSQRQTRSFRAHDRGFRARELDRGLASFPAGRPENQDWLNGAWAGGGRQQRPAILICIFCNFFLEMKYIKFRIRWNQIIGEIQGLKF